MPIFLLQSQHANFTANEVGEPLDPKLFRYWQEDLNNKNNHYKISNNINPMFFKKDTIIKIINGNTDPKWFIVARFKIKDDQLGFFLNLQERGSCDIASDIYEGNFTPDQEDNKVTDLSAFLSETKAYKSRHNKHEEIYGNFFQGIAMSASVIHKWVTTLHDSSPEIKIWSVFDDRQDCNRITTVYSPGAFSLLDDELYEHGTGCCPIQ